MNAALRKLRYPALVSLIALVSYAVLMGNAESALLPHAIAIRFLLGSPFTYVPEIGYHFASHQFAITPGCMGAKLFVSAFAILSLGFPARGGMRGARAARLCAYYMASLIGALGLTIARIAISIPFASHPHGQLIHNMLSYAIYFAALLALYITMQRRVHNGYRTETR